jgi:phospholipid/cholesterol/gamma-HCH transport system permease protein
MEGRCNIFKIDKKIREERVPFEKNRYLFNFVDLSPPYIVRVFNCQLPDLGFTQPRLLRERNNRLPMNQLAGHIGRRTLAAVDHLLNLFAFIYSILMLILQRPPTGRAMLKKFTLEQIYFTAFQALYVIIPIALLIGSMLIIQFAKVSTQYDLGKIMVLLIVREIGPIVTALIVILRTATAVSIEIGYMEVFHEIAAIEMFGIDPLRIICLPRLVGITAAILCLYVIFNLVAVIGGYLIVWIFTYIPIKNLFGQIEAAITFTDILVGIIKALLFGLSITVICLYHGFKPDLKITGIPAQTSRVAVECFFSCLVIDVIISVLFYM